MSKQLPVLCLDFDGVLSDYRSGWHGEASILDNPVSGAQEFVRQALERFTVCIYSARSSTEAGRKAMQAWMFKHGFPGCAPLPSPEPRVHFPQVKPPAKVVLDDRAITFRGIWPTVEQLQGFEPWTKRKHGKLVCSFCLRDGNDTTGGFTYAPQTGVGICHQCVELYHLGVQRQRERSEAQG